MIAMNGDEMKTPQLLNDYGQHRGVEIATRDLWNIRTRMSRIGESAVTFPAAAMQINQQGESL